MNDGVEFESIIDGEKVKLKLIVENLDIERKCDTEYHVAYTQLMARGILPRATLEKRMEDQGIWGKAEEEKLQDLQTELVKLQLELEDAKTHEQGLKIATKMGEMRAECLKLVEVKAAVLSNSCESLADQIRRDAYLAYATVYADTGKKVFLDYHDFIKRSDEQVSIDAREAMLKVATQTFNDSLTGLPEVSYVRKIENEIDNSDNVATATKTQKKTGAKKTTTRKTTTRKKTSTKKK